MINIKRGKKMFNIKNGNISLNNNFIIKKGLTKNEFIKSTLFKDVINQQITNGFSYFYLKPQLINNEKFIITLLFNQNDILDFLNISITKNDTVPSWNNWSESLELKKKETHDKWLEKNIGKPPYKYIWGEISSNYDPRSGSSMITISYK